MGFAEHHEETIQWFGYQLAVEKEQLVHSKTAPPPGECLSKLELVGVYDQLHQGEGSKFDQWSYCN